MVAINFNFTRKIMKLTTIKKYLLCLCLLSTAFAAEKNYNICHEEFWKEATVEKVASIPNSKHLCSKGKNHSLSGVGILLIRSRECPCQSRCRRQR